MSAVSMKVDSELERAVDRRHRLRLVDRSVELGHAHAAEALGGHVERRLVPAQYSPLHLVSLLGLQERCPAQRSGRTLHHFAGV